MTVQSTERGNRGSERGCPHLGLDGDPGTRCLFPAPEHRCHGSGQPEEIAEEHQADFCLSERYLECPLWEDTAADEEQEEQSEFEETVSSRSAARRQMEVTVLRTALVAVATLGLLLMLFAFILFSAPGGGDAAGGPASAEGRQVAGSAPTALPTEVLPAAPVDEAEATPPAEPDSPVNPEPASGEATRSYVVQPGDTLYSLAKKLGVSVDAVLEANGLDDPNFIWVGQTLKIPEPEP